MGDPALPWRRATVAEIASSIAIGPFGSALKADLYRPYGVPVLRGQNIGESENLILDDLVYVSPETAASLNRSVALPGDLVFPHRGAIGRVGLVKEGAYLLSSSMMKLTVDPTTHDPRFFFYFFRGPGRMELLNRASTVGTPGIGQPLRSLRSIPVTFPDLRTQRRISGVLAALDDKIAANGSIASHADHLARQSFEACASTLPFSDRAFADVATVKGGGTPSSSVSEYWNGAIDWASPTDITRLDSPYLFATARQITPEGLKNCSSELYPAGSILMTSRATIGAFALAQVPVAVNQGFIVVIPSDQTSRYWLFHEMRSRVDEFLTHANGATFLELSRGNFRRLPVRLASPAVMAEFGQRAAALHARAAAAARESAKLAELRDTLLPALMSGRLRVRDAKRAVEAVV